jgi:hypothetical protein
MWTGCRTIPLKGVSYLQIATHRAILLARIQKKYARLKIQKPTIAPGVILPGAMRSFCGLPQSNFRNAGGASPVPERFQGSSESGGNGYS